MSTKQETKEEAKTVKGESKPSTDVIDLSEVQLDKIQKLSVQENQANARLQEVRNQKNDFFELLLDAKGYTQEQMSRVTNVQLNEKNQVILTLMPESSPE